MLGSKGSGQPTLLYFDIDSLTTDSTINNGAILYRAGLMQRFQDDGIKVVKVKIKFAMGAPTAEVTRYFKDEEGIHNIHIHPAPETEAKKGWKRLWQRGSNKINGFIGCKMAPYRGLAQSQAPFTARRIHELIEREKVDAIITDYLYGLMFFPYHKDLGIKKYLITCNNEKAFYREFLTFHQSGKLNWYDWLGFYWFSRFEKKSYESCDKVIAIGPHDIPAFLPEQRRALMTCYLDDKAQRWRYAGDKTVFFVGNFGHYPNALAVKYLLKEIAPRVEVRNPEIRFAVLGTHPSHVPPELHRPNVLLMGQGNRQDAEYMFLNYALMLCPVENKFGQKFKIAEALSYGTPFLASKQSMEGYPYLSSLPAAPLEDPERSADMIVEYVENPSKLQDLQARTAQLHQSFMATQKGRWLKEIFCF